MFKIIILLLFGSCSKLFEVSEAGTTINCFTDRPSSVTGFNCRSEDPDDPVMKYPFWPVEAADGDDNMSSTRGEICGYPGFGYSCTTIPFKEGNHTIAIRPTLNISNDMYYVRYLDTTNSRIRIANRDFLQDGSRCPRPRRNFTLDDDQRKSSLSIDSVANTNLNIFYNCSVPPPPGSYNTTIDRTHPACLQVNHNNNQTQQPHSYAFLDEEIHDDGGNSRQPPLSNWYNNGSSYCDEIVILPTDDNWYSTGINDDYYRTLQRGFLLSWLVPKGDSRCLNCEATKGLCSYSHQNRSYLNCSCPPGTKLIRDDDGDDVCDSDSQPPDYGPSPSPTPNDKIPKNIIGRPTISKTKIGIVVSAGIGGLIILVILVSFIYLKIQRKRRETSSTTPNVESFLESYECLSVQRYRYSQIKKITNSFTDKLGQGGFGSVYKGTLADGRCVAVKVLVNDPAKKTSGEDFINEVATIGRTNHVNVVALIGFCSSGSRRALVYEFMANGSLEKFIYAKSERGTDDSSIVAGTGTIDNDGSLEKFIHARNESETSDASIATVGTINVNYVAKHPLGWEKLYQISVGIAKGLEYLHRGCNTRILHFDIKPHNILLDENFFPKISDFGLAKLCPTRDSIVSMLTGGRGTIGYIAPEVTCRNIGRVSHKSDVYSYGMMVLEMVGGRKNIDPFVENTSEIYFPHWIHNRLEEQGEKITDLLKIHEVVEEEMALKMIMVGLWCIQTNPIDRPSMNKVVDMLEGSIDNLQRPPKPSVYSSTLSPPPPPPPPRS